MIDHRHGREKVAVEAMKQGAEDYVPSPSTTSTARRCAARARAHPAPARAPHAARGVERDFSVQNLIGQGRAMKQISRSSKVAETDLSVLVRGESAPARTGRAGAATSAARAAPSRSSRELRGDLEGTRRERALRHEKGAFTGADARRVGKLGRERRHDLPRRDRRMAAETQAKVLRVAAGEELRAGRREPGVERGRPSRRLDPPRPLS